jgi:hypothetical protein
VTLSRCVHHGSLVSNKARMWLLFF